MAADDEPETALAETRAAASDEPVTPGAAEPVAAPGPGTLIGRYLVVRSVGAGGMGVVFEARDPDLGRAVAIKLLRGEGSATGQARMLREAQAMAQLTHPNVVRVYDVGTHGDGVFIAMELVAGEDLDARLARGPQPWASLWPLLRDAGRGLIAAHDAGIVHRDFKPHNVLVRGDGTALVTDFGLARSAAEVDPVTASGTGGERPALLDTPLTHSGAVMGTPQFMAPEQHRGEATDARTDQFAFCVTVYRALYGEYPFSGATTVELAEAVIAGRVAEPPPGARVPAWRRAAVVRGLAVDPARRYPSMRALLDQLERDPAARRRRWLAAGAGIAALVALVAVLAARGGDRPACGAGDQRWAAVWNPSRQAAIGDAFAASGRPHAAATAIRVADQLDRLGAAWRQTRVRVCQDTRVDRIQPEPVMEARLACLDREIDATDRLLALLARADPDLVDGATTAVAGLAGSGDCATVGAAPAAPLAEAAPIAATRQVVAGARAERLAGHDRAALALAERAVELARGTGHDPVIADALFELGESQRLTGAREPAASSWTEAAALAEASDDDRLRADTLRALAIVVGVEMARPDDGLRYLTLARSVIERLGDRWRRATLTLAEGRLLTAAGRYPQALAAYQQGRDLLAASSDGETPESAQVMARISELLLDLGRTDEALAAAREAVAIGERVWGPDNPRLGAALTPLGSAYLALGRLDDARAALERTLTINERNYAGPHPALLRALNHVGNVYAGARELPRALELFERAVAVGTALAGPDDLSIATPLVNAASVLDMMGRLDESRAYAERALRIKEKQLPPDHPELAEGHATLGDALLSLGRLDEARTEYQAALAIRLRLGAETPRVAASHIDLAGVLAQQGRFDDSVAEYRQAIAIFEEHPDPEQHGSAWSNLGDLFLMADRCAEASDAYQHAFDIWHAAYGDDHPIMSYPLLGRGMCLTRTGRAAEAVPLVERSLALRRDSEQAESLVAESQYELALALWAADQDRPRALQLMAQARDGYAASGPTFENETAAAAAWLRRHSPHR